MKTAHNLATHCARLSRLHDCLSIIRNNFSADVCSFTYYKSVACAAEVWLHVSGSNMHVYSIYIEHDASGFPWGVGNRGQGGYIRQPSLYVQSRPIYTYPKTIIPTSSVHILYCTCKYIPYASPMYTMMTMMS